MGSQTRNALLHPLAEFYRSSGWELPLVQDVSGITVPAAVQAVLVHGHEMTVGLERHHETTVGLRVLARRRRDDLYARQVVLTRADDGLPLALAAVELRLDAFPASVRAQVLAEDTPLGHIVRRACPTVRRVHHGYFRLRPDAHVRDALQLGATPWTYGRRGILTDNGPHPIAHVIEVVRPPQET